jgi:RNA polymerase sigma factor (TIGR02999 family)
MTTRLTLDDYFPLVYAELKRIASRQLHAKPAGNTLQTTTLVHEAYLKLRNERSVNLENRAQFFAIAAQAMRRILLDHARSRVRQKRGGGWRRISFDESAGIVASQASELIAIDEALIRLQAMDSRAANVVELRFFGGLSVEQTAEVLGISAATVKRESSIAKAWLSRELLRPKHDTGAMAED